MATHRKQKKMNPDFDEMERQEMVDAIPSGLMFRPHRGSVKESIEDIEYFHTLSELKKIVRKLGFPGDSDDIQVCEYLNIPDDRIWGWNKTCIVIHKDHFESGVIGFTNGIPEK